MANDKTAKEGRLSTSTHALIGAGHMGGALLNGWLKAEAQDTLHPANILVIDPAPGAAAQNALRHGVKFSSQLTKGSASGLKLCLLAIKPQLFQKIGPELADALPKDVLIVSIMAGIGVQELSAVFEGQPIVRAMPNTPGAIGKGITAYYASPDASSAQSHLAEACLLPAGKVVNVASERHIDMVTAISGSGPAYVFYLTEALAAAGEKLGLEPDLAQTLARQTVIGSGAMLENSSQSAETLRKAVTSPGGTTEAALRDLMDSEGLPLIMRRAVTSAYNRSRELGGN